MEYIFSSVYKWAYEGLNIQQIRDIKDFYEDLSTIDWNSARKQKFPIWDIKDFFYYYQGVDWSYIYYNFYSSE